ncbi:tripartite motif-containing protein 45-like [Crassostrea angulata]|uniref:tripartite motif-containing protein 45-like n=1 Tax=Magallana angulata TaxID=2784310 RepID=UPI0022B0EEC2|nr:tripartite motif-containing protein 45-like [Crassostrea angulata]
MAKANVDNQMQLNNLTVCPVCFQKYIIPRILPCSHTFCHACLDSHIKSSCEKTTPLGFTCPLCRDFVPAPGVVGQYASDKWSELIPTNKFIVSLLEKCGDLVNSAILCDVCKTDEKEEIAVNWCKDCESTYCETCSNMHKKLNPVLKHEIVSFNDATNGVGPDESTPKFCSSHPDCKIDLFCRDHQMSSCALCVLLNHRACKHIGSIREEAANSDITKIKANGLLKEMKRVCYDLEKVIESEQRNIRENEENVDLFSEMIRHSYERWIKRLKEVKERQLDQLAKMSKDSKLKLESSIKKYENCKMYLGKCQKTLEGVLDSNDHKQTLLWYSLMKENVAEIQKMEFRNIRMDLTSTPNEENACKIENFEKFVNLNVQEKVTNIPEVPLVVDFRRSQKHVIKKWKIPHSSIRGGAFSPNGDLILTDLFLKRLTVFSEEGVLQRELTFSNSTWGMHYDQNTEVGYVTFPQKQEIKLINLHDFAEIKTFAIKFAATGITSVNGKFFVIGAKSLCLFNSNFEVIEKTGVDANSDDITSDDSGNIIYSCYQKNTVTKKNKANKIMFVYRHNNLESPYGLAVDHIGNIYVCGHHSNNIHVISESGETLRVLYGFQRPQFIAFQCDSFKFFVVDENGVGIYELH